MRRFTVLMTALLFCAAAFTYAQSPQAVIREITGTMEVKLPGSDAWTPANAGDSVELATVLSTGFKSTAVIAVGGSTLTVRPLTQLSLESLMNMDETEIIGIEMRTGRIQADVSAPLGSKTDFTVRTPATTASVRGTAFYIDPENLRVREGTVKYSAVKNSRRSVMVGAGQSSWLDKKTGGAVP
ncbi:MAG: FecR family protein, partial [Treponema sp.]|nr:FecR family protein [Treponema sp.]